MSVNPWCVQSAGSFTDGVHRDSSCLAFTLCRGTACKQAGADICGHRVTNILTDYMQAGADTDLIQASSNFFKFHKNLYSEKSNMLPKWLLET